MSRLLAYGVGLAAALTTALPAFRSPHDDGYPFSTYPMFANVLERPALYIAEGVDASGAAHKLEPQLMGTGQVMQAVMTVESAVTGGKRSQKRLCKEIAARVAASNEYGAIERVRLVTATYDPIAYFTKGPEPLERKLHEQCRVVRNKAVP